MSNIDVYGAREHNLKNIDATIPHGSERKRQVIARVRYALCRGTATLHRDLLGLCP